MLRWVMFLRKRKIIILVWLSVCCMVLFLTREESDALENCKKTLIIDAGHGGADGGAESKDGTLESDINLEISKYVESLANFCGIEYIMTRENDDITYPSETDTIRKKKVWDQKQRCKLINSIKSGILLSIHQNFYPSSKPYGPQVFFSEITGGSDFAEIVQTNLNSSLCPENRRLAAPISEEIFLMKQSKKPSILVECGFLSNPNELKLLKDNQYQIKLATVMVASYLKFTDL